MKAHTVMKINPKTPDVVNVTEVKIEVECPETTLFESEI